MAFLVADALLIAALIWAITTKVNLARGRQQVEMAAPLPAGAASEPLPAPSDVRASQQQHAPSSEANSAPEAAPSPAARPAADSEGQEFKRRILFQIRTARPRQVSLIGDFNSWKPQPMQKDQNNLWKIVVPLPPGKYKYLFLFDEGGRTVAMLDPNNAVKVPAPRAAPARTASQVSVKPK